MKFDTVILGGGLSGLTAGIALQKKGLRTVIVSAGQNALHFSSGSFDLLSRLPDGKEVQDPVKEASKLPEEHPYKKISGFAALAQSVPSFFEEAGIKLHGDLHKNSLRLTPAGSWKSSWLSLEGCDSFQTKDEIAGKKILIVNFAGFPDFNTAFLAEGLEKEGCQVRIVAISTPEIDRLRQSPSEMRSVNIARVADMCWLKIADEIKALVKDDEAIILPQAFGLKDAGIPERLKAKFKIPVYFIGTMPPSVPGIRTQMQLKKHFEALGGTFLMGDAAVSATVEDGRILSVEANNAGKLEAAEFILATGALFSQGLVSNMQKISERLFGLDVEYPENRNDWYNPDFFSPQPYMEAGVKTDGEFRPLKDGQPLVNLHACGSILAGSKALELGCGAGTAILTALSVAGKITDK